MEAKYLYIDGEYVHTNQELWGKVQKLIDSKNTNGEASIRMLSDLYRNGHLIEFCSQNEYSAGKEVPNSEVTFDENLTGDIRIADHIAERLSKGLCLSPFSSSIRERFIIHAISITREEAHEPEIKSVSYNPGKNKNAESVFLLNGFRQQKFSKKKAKVNITYTIDNKESLEDQIPISIGVHTEILNMSKNRGKKVVSIRINETDLDPLNDILILIGEGGSYGKIILKAPQITINIHHDKEIIPYQMMRVFNNDNKCLYIGVWPFEYDNSELWRKNFNTSDNYLYEKYYSKREVKFYVLLNNCSHNFIIDKGEFFSKFTIDEDSITALPSSKRWELKVPSPKDWENFASLKSGNEMRGSIVYQTSKDENYPLSSEALKQRIIPNQFGLYAMLGNIHEMASYGNSIYYMGGNLCYKGEDDLKEISPWHDEEKKRVPFYCIRLVMQGIEDYPDNKNEDLDDYVDTKSLDNIYLDRLRNWG